MFDSLSLILADTKKARQLKQYNRIIDNAQAVLDYLPDIIAYEVEQEQQYRQFEAKLLDEREESGKLRTSSYCETKAKATDFYANYRKAQLFRELSYEVVQISKKIARSNEQEYNAH